MFLNFVFSAACKHKRGGGETNHSARATAKQTNSSSWGALHQRHPRAGEKAVGPFREIVLGLKCSCPSLRYCKWGLFIFNGHQYLGTAHSGLLFNFPLWGLVPLSQAICPYQEQEQQQEKIEGRTDSISKTVFIHQEQKRARDDQMFRSISSCETFEKTHSKSSKWVNLWASQPAPPQTWSLVPVYCWTHWSVYSPFIIHEKSQWSSQYIRRNNSDHLSTALLFLFPSPRGFHLLRFFLN